MGFFSKKSDVEQYNDVVTKMKKKLEIAQKITELNLEKIYDLEKKRELEKHEKNKIKINKKIETITEELDVMKQEMIKAIVQSMELFEMEDDDGTTLTQEKLEQKKLNEIIGYLQVITIEMEKITWKKHVKHANNHATENNVENATKTKKEQHYHKENDNGEKEMINNKQNELYIPTWQKILNRILNNKKIYASQISKKENMTLAHINKEIKKLENKNYIHREQKGIKKEIQLTRKGMNIAICCEQIIETQKWK